ncbi:MAG TPA: acetyl-CoA C-acyltransferase [Acidimicrobiales bacterium]|nr:acetyl-CoA C-acyltransferase [Acidimicrobiales bacterium]
MPGSVIVAGARTPIAKLSGALAGFSATDLGGLAIAAALARAGVAPDQVDYVYMGQVVLAGAGQNPARHAAHKAGIPLTTPAATISKVCLSGLNAVYLADQMIAAGDADVVVAGGQESMTAAPHLLPGARGGYRIGHATVYDAMMYDGLEDAFSHAAMGATSEWDLAAFPAVTRARQDEWAAQSHERAAAAIKEGRLASEIVAVEVPQRRGEAVTFDTDEGVRPGTTASALGALQPAFSAGSAGGSGAGSAGGSITAGNASQISDGASALVLMSPAAAARARGCTGGEGVAPLGEVVGYGQVAGPGTCLMTQPSHATTVALGRAGLSLADVGLFEWNEAFAAVTLASIDDLGVDPQLVNVNGGAVALGHPIGATGNRLALTLCHELGRRGGGVGVAALCGGGGQGDALVVRVA